MRGEKREEWERLCQLAADEQDPDKLMHLVKRINELLQEKEQRMSGQHRNATAAQCTSPPTTSHLNPT
jgi:hypothetical protein